MIVLSLDPEANYSPFGEKLTLETPFKCPLRHFNSSPVLTSQILIVLSIELEAISLLSGEKHILVSQSRCPLIIFISFISFSF